MESIHRRVVWAVAAAVVMFPAMAGASTKCGGEAGDGAQVAAVRALLDTTCPCNPGSGKRAAYLRCANDVISDAVARGALRSACRSEVREGVVRSTCGRDEGAAVCCSERATGAPSCRIVRSAGGCKSSRSRIAWVESSESCADACGVGCAVASDCDDGNACTADACDAVLGCTHQAITGCGVPPPPPPPGDSGSVNCAGTAPSTWELDAEEKKLIELVNKERKKQGRAVLKTCRSISKAAQKHSADMRDRDYFSHKGKNGSTYIDRMCDAGYVYCRDAFAGEVLTADRRGAAGAFEDWMGSPSHKYILLHGSMRVAGVGYACGGRYGGYWTVDLSNLDEASCN